MHEPMVILCGTFRADLTIEKVITIREIGMLSTLRARVRVVLLTVYLRKCTYIIIATGDPPVLLTRRNITTCYVGGRRPTLGWLLTLASLSWRVTR